VSAPTIVWLRDDLRLEDHPALTAAVDRGGPLVVAYVLDDVSPQVRPLGAAARWWLHHSLAALDARLREAGGRLVLRRGPAERVIPALVAEAGAGAVHWSRRASAAREVDARLKAALVGAGVEATSHPGALLHEPWTVPTGQGGPYRVFTPYWRACLARPVRVPLPVPPGLGDAGWVDLASDRLDDWALRPTRPDWADGLRATWTPGELGAAARLDAFVADGLARYDRRDVPAAEATSRLSPHLRFGEISPARIWARLETVDDPGAVANLPRFRAELGWREFAWHLLFHEPDLAVRNHRREFDRFPWVDDPVAAEAWRRGRTGIPLVDAGMHELWATGWMHNRVRMVAASVLVKHLRIDWRVGEAWFWDTLVDADEANNPAGWQWVAGSGADSAPYPRVFNPVLQAEKFDPDGDYVRRWAPEFAGGHARAPIVDLAEGRRAAIAAFESMRRARVDGAAPAGAE